MYGLDGRPLSRSLVIQEQAVYRAGMSLVSPELSELEALYVMAEVFGFSQDPAKNIAPNPYYGISDWRQYANETGLDIENYRFTVNGVLCNDRRVARCTVEHNMLFGIMMIREPLKARWDEYAQEVITEVMRPVIEDKFIIDLCDQRAVRWASTYLDKTKESYAKLSSTAPKY